MPPKRPRGGSIRRSARSSTNAENSSETAEDAKPSIAELNSAAELPSNPLASTLEPIAQPSASNSVTATSSLSDLPAASSTATSNQYTSGTSTDATSTQITDAISTLNTPIPSAPGSSNAQDSVTRQEASTTPASRGKRLLSQPKHPGRRSQARLQELQKAEADRKKAETESRLPAGTANAKRDGKGRGGASTGRARGRGRGGYVGGSVRAPPRIVASGPFGAAQAIQQAKQHAASQSASRSRAKATPTASSSKSVPASNIAEDGKLVKQEAGTGQDQDGDVSMLDRPRYFIEDGGYISSDADEDGKIIQRLNVEDLGLIDLTQDDTEVDNFAPVRVTRFAHKERAFGINADGATNQDGVITVDANDTATATTSDRKPKAKTRDNETIEEERIFQGTYSESDSDSKPRVRVAGKVRDPPPTATSEMIKDPPSSPDMSRKSKGKLKARAVTGDEGDYHTRDELDEWERHQQDLETIRNTLGIPAASLPQQEGVTPSAATGDKRAENVFLFQFPPIMPELTSPTIKVERDVDETQPKPTSINEPMIISDGGDAATSANEQRQTFPSGFVGKLRVHASGRVSLDWGGADMCLQMGSNASFLQDVVIANLPEAKEDDDVDVAQTGTAMSMGQVKGKFVLVPDLDEIMK